jgi:hypothetical protein
MTVVEFVVGLQGGRWLMRTPEGEPETFDNEDDALRAADRAARLANYDHLDSRVIRLGANGVRHLVRSYGRHPLVTSTRRIDSHA